MRSVSGNAPFEDVARQLQEEVGNTLVAKVDSITGEGNYTSYGFWLRIKNEGEFVTVKAAQRFTADADIQGAIDADYGLKQYPMALGNAGLLAIQDAVTDYNLRLESFGWVEDSDSKESVEDARVEAEKESTAAAEAEAAKAK